MNDLLTDYPEVSAEIAAREFFEALDTFREVNAHSLLGCVPKVGSENTDREIQKSNDQLISYITSFCATDCKKKVDFHSREPKSSSATGSVVIESYDENRDKLNPWKVAQKEGSEAWKIIRKHLIDGVLEGIKYLIGSTVIEGKFSNRDRALLFTLHDCGLLEMLLEDHGHIKEVKLDHDMETLPLKFVEFLGSLEILANSYDEKMLENFGQRWAHFEEVSQIATNLSKNDSLLHIFRRCG